MPKLAVPQYISQARPQGVVRPANIPGAVDVGGLVSGLANASSIVSNQAARDANEAERIKAQQEHEARQLAEGEAKVAVANAVSEAQSNWTERLTTAMQSAPADALNFTANTLKEFDAFAEQAVAKVPELGQQAMRERLAGIRNQIHGRAFQFETDARNAKIGGDYNSGLELDRNTVSADPSQYNQLLANRLSLLQGLGLGAETTAKMAEATRHDMAKSAAEGMVARSPETFLKRTGMAGGKTGKDGQPLPTDPAKAAEAVQNDPVLRNLKPEVLTSLVERATMLSITRQQQKEMALQRRQREYEAHLNRASAVAQAFQMQADKGTMLDPAYVNQAITATAGTPFQAVIKSTAQQVQEIGGFSAQPLPVQRAALDAIDAQIALHGRNPALDKRREQIAKVVQGSESDLKADPLRAGLQRGVIDSLPPIDFQGGTSAVVQQLAARVPLAQRVSAWSKQPTSPMTSDEADQFKQQLDALPAKERAGAVAELARAIGPQQAQGLAVQMDAKDRALGLAFASAGDMTTSGRFTSELILKGQQAKKDGTSTKGQKQPDLKASTWKAHASEQLAGVFPNQNATNATRDAAELIMHGIAAEQGGELSEDDMDRAVRLAVGGSIVEHNGARIPLPAGMDEDALATRLSTVRPEDLATQTGGGNVRAGGVPVPVDQFIKSLPGQKLMAVRPGQFAVLVQGRPVTNEKGSPIIIKVN